MQLKRSYQQDPEAEERALRLLLTAPLAATCPSVPTHSLAESAIVQIAVCTPHRATSDGQEAQRALSRCAEERRSI